MTNTLFIPFRYKWLGFEIHMNIVIFIIHTDSTQVKETCKEGFDHTLPKGLKPSQKMEILIN